MRVHFNLKQSLAFSLSLGSQLRTITA